MQYVHFSITVGLIFHTMDRHYRGYLSNRPSVGKRLEYREITKVHIEKSSVNSIDFFRNIVQIFCKKSNFRDEVRPAPFLG